MWGVMGSWYRDFYNTALGGEQAMRAALQDVDTGAENRADIENRLAELKQVPQDRCVISSEQVRFIERMLTEQ